ncbi:MAG: class I SAM-dependent methyltransferase [Chloroflexota bacterium]
MPDQIQNEMRIWQNWWEKKGWLILFRKSEAFHDFLYRILPKLDSLGITKGKDVLEVGCGSGWTSVTFKRHFPEVNYTSSDVAPYALRYVRMLGEWTGALPEHLVACPIENLPFKDNSFDYVLGTACLHHVTNLNQGLSEIFRVLKPNGYYIGFGEGYASSIVNKIYHWLNIGSSERGSREGINENLLRFSQWIKSFKRAGFNVEHVELERKWYYKEPHLWEYNTHSLMTILYYVLTKPLPDRFMKHLGASLTIIARKS